MDGKDWSKKVSSFKERIKREKAQWNDGEAMRKDMAKKPPPIPRDAGETPPPIPKDAYKAKPKAETSAKPKEGSNYSKKLMSENFSEADGYKRRYDREMAGMEKAGKVGKGIGAGLAALAVGKLVDENPDLQLTIQEAGKGSDELPEDEQKKKRFINMINKAAKGN